MSEQRFQKLYKRDSTGKVRSWETWVDDNYVYQAAGVVGGAIQTTHNVVHEGKNIGRANATTPHTQALAEAQSVWERKIKEGYIEDYDKAAAGESHRTGVAPMLAKDYREVGGKYKTFPAYVQPKLDGMRMLSPVHGLYSRKQEPLHFPHFAEALAHVRQKFPLLRDVTFDGEIYLHRYNDNFQQLMSIARKRNHPQQHILEYWVYDLAIPELTFHQRHNLLMRSFESFDFRNFPIKLVATFPVQTQAEAEEKEAESLEAGYEGVMYRNPYGLYEHKRSFNLLKLKQFNDAEFEVLGIVEGQGKLMGHAGALRFMTETGIEFYAKPALPDAALRAIFNRPQDYIGKMATIKFQGVSNDGVPRFPVVKDFREAHE